MLPHLLPGHLISDVVAILGSLDFVMGRATADKMTNDQ